MTYKELQAVNESMKTIDVKGKNYAQVNERVKAFRQLYPEGKIMTDIVKMENGVVTMRATVYGADGAVLATGYANEKESSSYINKTSYIENCETSAVGRALGFLGIGIDVEIASAEEMQNATVNEEPDLIKAKNRVGKMITYLQKNGMSISEIAAETRCKTDKVLQSWLGSFDSLYALENELSALCEKR